MVSEEFIIGQYVEARRRFPKLKLPIRVHDHWEICGSIDVIDDDGSYWDNYDVKIKVPQSFPEELFVLEETGGKIPKEAKWHNSQSCCLSTNAVIYSVLGDDLSLLNWLVKFAHPYLANHIVNKETGEYAGGEFLHSTDGIIQGYEKLFSLSGAKEVCNRLKTLCTCLKLNRNDKCFCGSGKKFKNCYMLTPITHKYSGVPYALLARDLAEINDRLYRKAKLGKSIKN